MNSKMMFLALTGIAVGTAGCSSMGQTDKFGCPGMPAGVVCKSPAEVYRLTHNADHVTDSRMDDEEDDTSKKRPDAAPVMVPQMQSGDELVSRAKNGMPLLEQAKVARIWLAPWIDKRGDLHMPSYIFTEVAARKWSFGEDEAISNRPLVPLQIEYRAETNNAGETEADAIGEDAKTLYMQKAAQTAYPAGNVKPSSMGALPTGLMPH